MNPKSEKPTPEAKALSLFLMAHRTIDPMYKEKLKRINRLWDLVVVEELSKTDYLAEVQSMLDLYGGYTAVIEKTVKYYLEKTGEWKLKGDDQYSQDAQKIADKMMKK